MNKFRLTEIKGWIYVYMANDMEDLPTFPEFPEFLLREQYVRVPMKLPTPRTSPVPRSPCFGDGWYESVPLLPGPRAFGENEFDCYISPKTMFRQRLNSLPLEGSITESELGSGASELKFS